jgi:hypothetical protein
LKGILTKGDLHVPTSSDELLIIQNIFFPILQN